MRCHILSDPARIESQLLLQGMRRRCHSTWRQEESRQEQEERQVTQVWVFTKDGFLSAVQHDDDRSRMRVRARRREHLESAFPGFDIVDLQDGDVIHDYRWHLDVARGEWVDYLVGTAMDVDYTSHVKEAISGDDKQMYRAMLRVWTAMLELQTGELKAGDLGYEVDEFGWDNDLDEERRRYDDLGYDMESGS